jgi:hypothetical protein
MLSLQELRSACSLTFNVKPTFRACLIASLNYEKEKLGELLFNVDFTLSQFKKLITLSEANDPEEERLIINTIKRVKEPTVLDLLLALCESNVRLKYDLEKAGLNMESLSIHLKDQIAGSIKSFLDSIVPASPNSLTHLSNIRMN